MATQAFTIDLPDALAEMVHTKVATGEYASASDVFQDGLEALAENEAWLPSGPAFERWVRDELRPAVEAYRADPSILITADVVRAELDALYAEKRATR